jgi:hypothetical protein
MIKPTIGRKVWYWPSAEDKGGNYGMRQFYPTSGNELQPFDATIIAVWNDRLVNLHVIDHVGRTFFVQQARLLQEGEKSPTSNSTGKDLYGYAAWMPYQVSQAKKPELTIPLTTTPTPAGDVIYSSDPRLMIEVVIPIASFETKYYPDGSSATGTAPLPDHSGVESAAA